MADPIKFAFVLNQNLNRKSFKVPQATVEIVVKGAEDPLTHQRMRDAVSHLFEKTQKSINDDIVQRDLRISRMGVNEKKQKKGQEIAAGNKKIQDLLATFKKEATQELEEFKKSEAELEEKAAEAVRRENWRAVSWTINTLWTGFKILSEATETVMGTSTAPVLIPVAIKNFVDNLMDLKGLYEDWGKYYSTLPGMRKKLREGLTALKTKTKLTKSEVEQFAKDVALFEEKLLVLESKTKAMSAKVTSLLSAVPKKDLKPEALKKAEDTLHNCLEELVAASLEIKSASTYMITLKKKLGVAKANAKSDSTFLTVSSWAGTAYTTMNNLKDFVLKPDEWVTWIDGAVKVFTSAGNWATGAN